MQHDKEPYYRLGQKREEWQPPDICYLVLADFIEAIDPKNYFITSGEAVAKAKKLEEDIWKMAGNARKLVNALKKARGEAKYLETEWQPSGQLTCKQKNPRKPRPKPNK